MADADDPLYDAPPDPASRRVSLWPRRKRLRAIVLFIGFIVAGTLFGWMTRDRIATGVIDDQLAAWNLPATYEIESIDPARQVLRNVVVGDPTNPDLTIERAVVYLRYRFGVPAIGRVVLVKPRLFGSYRDGKLSFGALDPVLFAPSEEPAALPDIDLRVDDGRGLLETDFGPIGLKLDGEGELDSGFVGTIAAVAPEIQMAGCRSDNATLYGKVVTSGGEPRFAGPVRLRGASCEGGTSLASLDVQADLSLDKSLSVPSGEFRFAGEKPAAAGFAARTLEGNAEGTWAKGLFAARYDVAFDDATTEQFSARRIAFDGGIRVRGAMERSEIDLSLTGTGLRGREALGATFDVAEDTLEDTMLGPLLGKVESALERELRDASFRADLDLRQTGSVWAGVIPSASLTGASGTNLLSVSQGQFTNTDSGNWQVSGNFASAGNGLPKLRGRMERAPGGRTIMRLRMERYAEGRNALEIPLLVVTQSNDQRVGFAGEVRASGRTPGGEVDGLVLPVSGNWSQTGGLSLWRECTAVRFASLQMADLAVRQQQLTLCPARGAPILALDGNGMRMAAGIPSISVDATLGDTPMRMTSGAVGVAYPGNFAARDISVMLGPEGEASFFAIAELKASLGDDIGGTLSGGDIRMAAVPLDIGDMQGRWGYAGGVLTVTDGTLRVTDRDAEDRFEPLVARDAELRFAESILTGQALLRHPQTDREVTRVSIRHDLGSGSGRADLLVDGLLFDEKLQPEDLTVLAKGTVALVEGSVSGKGRIAWDENEVTSSGEFRTESLDFAAAFGPVEGARGTIVFTDLINLTTAPDQYLHIDAINPGVLVRDGEVRYAIRDGEVVSVAGGEWPFMGGTLVMRPVDLNFAVTEPRRYVFEIIGLDAATFIEEMEFANIAATGTFDGTIPIEFDEDGNGSIAQSLLLSRPPGGNLSYVGELTYEDLSPIANFAFDSLKSLDFRQMMVEMEGPLAGEIVTRLRFDGISQGETASRNFVTRRIAKLPLQFQVNINARFYELITMVRGFYDPTYLRDPRELGLLDDDGNRFVVPARPTSPATKPEETESDEPAIQPQESENLP